MALLAFYRPYRETGAALVAVTVSLAWLMHRTQPGMHWLPATLATILSPAIAVLAVVAVRARIDRIAPLIAQSEAAATAALTQRAQLAALQQIGDQRISRIRTQVQPFLTALSEGRLDRGDPQVRSRAAVLEAAVRDDLQLGAALDVVARHLIEQARFRGASIEFNISSDAADMSTPLLSQIVRAALSATPQRLVISTTTNAAEAGVITILLSPAETADPVKGLVLAAGGTARHAGQIILLTLSNTAVKGEDLSWQVGTGGQPRLEAKLAW